LDGTVADIRPCAIPPQKKPLAFS